MKAPIQLSILLYFLVICSCSEPLDLNQIKDYVSKPVFTSSLTYFTVVPAKFFDSTGTIQQNSITDTADFKAIESQFVNDNLVQMDFNAEIKNEFDRDVTIKIEFLDDSNSVYTFAPLIIQSKDLNFTFLEEIDIAANPQILNANQVKITAELENTGTQMDLNDPSEFEFKSSVTFYIESSF